MGKNQIHGSVQSTISGIHWGSGNISSPEKGRPLQCPYMHTHTQFERTEMCSSSKMLKLKTVRVSLLLMVSLAEC